MIEKTHVRTKKYVSVNHLGNVLVVYSDKRLNQCSSGSVLYYKADILTATDYSPFGVSIKNYDVRSVDLGCVPYVDSTDVIKAATDFSSSVKSGTSVITGALGIGTF